ncbi:hypothetical protein [Chamaesiphon sp. GL140_3_metabinner_50]|uniref:hypothetical protein n=1 Tax=Chamaesiphon sp. GL140_3_metabinner_50 TaxID=2970812 RepID=UPI0025F5C4ED|nr:hypothetical protein [Chamaesiphon sp. GL140_3_metabinner_50]
MFKKIWQSFVRWFRKLFGGGTGKAINRFPAAELPPLDDTDREYLFMQLLEGVAHGWQQPRAIGFFNKIRQRVRKSEWLEWLERFGQNLLAAPVANYELAGRMVQLGQLDCGEIGDLAGDYGARLLDRQAEEYPLELLPIMEFSDLAPVDADELNFDEVPMELLLDNDPLFGSRSGAVGYPPDPEQIGSDTHEITLEEFSAMLYKDPGLVAELAEQFQIDTTDPQVIINAVVAQMQQQIQQISGDLTPIATEQINPQPLEVPATPQTAPPEIPAPPPEIPNPPPTAPPEIPAPPEVPATPPTAPPEIPAPSPTPIAPETTTLPLRDVQIPPPPPVPKLEYKSDDPWSNNLLETNEATPKTANLPEHHGV